MTGAQSEHARMPAAATKPKQKPKPKPRKATEKESAPTPDARRPAPAAAPAVAAPERHQNEGHGRRLTQAFEALEAFPALAESRDRLLSVIAKDHVATADIVSAVESDVA